MYVLLMVGIVNRMDVLSTLVRIFDTDINVNTDGVTMKPSGAISSLYSSLQAGDTTISPHNGAKFGVD